MSRLAWLRMRTDPQLVRFDFHPPACSVSVRRHLASLPWPVSGPGQTERHRRSIAKGGFKIAKGGKNMAKGGKKKLRWLRVDKKP